jgi:hypothetical protein
MGCYAACRTALDRARTKRKSADVARTASFLATVPIIFSTTTAYQWFVFYNRSHAQSLTPFGHRRATRRLAALPTYHCISLHRELPDVGAPFPSTCDNPKFRRT